MKKVYVNTDSQCCNKDELIKSLIEDNKLCVEFIYQSDFFVTKDLREFVWIIWENFWFERDLISRLILLSDELNNNAIEHWSSQNWENFLRLKIEKQEDGINFVMEVEDDWKWKEAKTALEMETMRAHKLKIWFKSHDSIRWRWLFLIAVKIADRVYFKNSERWGLIVWIKKLIKKENN